MHRFSPAIVKPCLSRQSGSVFTVLLGGVLILAALSFGAYQMLSGPLATASRVTHNNLIKTQLETISRVAIVDATLDADGGDCDADGYIEPRPFRVTTGDAPVNGGLIPDDMGAPVYDPWGMEYGYCAWDVGVQGGSEEYIISTGTFHTCAIKGDGSGWCWGGPGWHGLLGDGEGSDSSVPVTVSGSGSWLSITAGAYHSCGIKADGSGWCWGRNSLGQLGIGGTTSSLAPSALSGGGTWTTMTAGSNHTCGIKSDGIAWCWGYGNYGQLGTGDTDNSDVPAQVSGGDTWIDISAGFDHSCGIKTDGSAWCWGSDTGGKLGNDAAGNSNTPSPVSGGGIWTSITVGNYHSCGIQADGTAWCWGMGTDGRLGTGSDDYSQVPVAVSGGSTWRAIAAASSHTCGIKTDGTAWCWGSDSYGQLGTGGGGNSNVPVEVSGSSLWSGISAGNEYSCGRKDNGSAWCWGYNDYGKLGDGSTTDSSLPVEVTGSSTWGDDAPAEITINNPHQYNSSGASSYSTSYTVPDIENRILVVALSNKASSVLNGVINSVTFDGTALVKADSVQMSTSWVDTTALYYMINPPAVAANIQVNLGGSTAGFGLATYTLGNVKQAGPEAVNVGYAATSPLNTSVTTLTDHALIVDAFASSSSGALTITPTQAGQTLIGTAQNLSAAVSATSYLETAAAGSYSLGWDHPTTVRMTQVVAAFAPADSGEAETTSVCSETERLKGSDNPYTGALQTRTVLALISAGPDRVFQTTCNEYIDGTADLITTAGDDIVQRYTYEKAAAASSNLWALKSGDPDTAEIHKNLEIGNNITVDRAEGLIQASTVMTTDKITAGGGMTLGSETVITECETADEGVLRYNTSTSLVEVCDGDDWQNAGGSGSLSWPLRAPNGSAGAPSYSFSSYPESGIYADANTLYLKAPSGSNVSLMAEPMSEFMVYDNNIILGSTGEMDILATSPTIDFNSNVGSDYRIQVEGAVQIGYTSGTCDSSSEGTIRYIPATKHYQFCDGEDWINLTEPGNISTPVFSTVTAGRAYQSCAILESDQSGWCWGYGSNGQLGTGSEDETHVPAPLFGGGTWTSISGGMGHTCGTKADGTAWCWGDDLYGYLGNGSTSGDQLTPDQVSGSGSWIGVAAGSNHTCGIKTDGTAWCWGEGQHGKLGNGSESNRTSPAQVSGGGTWTHISAGGGNSCGIKDDGTAWCWGGGNLGALGTGSVTWTPSLVPVEVAGGDIWKSIAAGGGFACGIKEDDTAWCWGSGNQGQLGNGSTSQQWGPVAVSGGHHFIAIAAGWSQACGIRTDGALLCWGNGYFESGPAWSTTTTPVVMPGSGGWTEISMGVEHGCGRKSDGSVWCFWRNDHGQVSLASTDGDQATPIEVAFPVDDDEGGGGTTGTGDGTMGSAPAGSPQTMLAGTQAIDSGMGYTLELTGFLRDSGDFGDLEGAEPTGEMTGELFSAYPLMMLATAYIPEFGMGMGMTMALQGDATTILSGYSNLSINGVDHSISNASFDGSTTTVDFNAGMFTFTDGVDYTIGFN